MRSVGLFAAIPLVAGVAAGMSLELAPAPCLAALLLSYPPAIAAWWFRRHRVCPWLLALSFLSAGGTLGAGARAGAVDTPLRAALDDIVGGMDPQSLGPPGEHDPVRIRARLVEDAVAFADYASLTVHVSSLEAAGGYTATRGGLRLSVGGEAFRERLNGWRAGREIAVPVTFRRPARYLNDGVADFERELALSGTTLFASAKSGLLVDVTAAAGPVAELAAEVRARVRRAVERHVAPHDPVSAAMVTAVLIGERAGLPDDVRDRLQRAGTYHIIAISGGNIAIFVMLTLGALAVFGIRGPAAPAISAVVLVAYAHIVVAGPSVWRATAMAVVYLLARFVDHRTAPWQAISVAAALMAVIQPSDVRDAGFVLTFGATAALIEGARHVLFLVPPGRLLTWVAASLAAAASVEVVLMPVSAQVFSRVTGAGLVLNLIAVPMMAVVQLGGMIVAAVPEWKPAASAAGWAAHAAAFAILESARLVDVAPDLSARVPPPGPVVLGAYYGGLALLVWTRRRSCRLAGVAVLLVAGAVLLSGAAATAERPGPGVLRLTMFDVGQAEATLLQLPSGEAVLVDSGGAPFGEGFDIGGRVLVPALWARGVRALDALLITHGDPDHLGGAPVIVDEFRPRHVWEGIEVPAHAPTAAVRQLAESRGRRTGTLRAGRRFRFGGAQFRVLHPPEPDWERPRVRNDDSVVVEVRHGTVVILLTGDISAPTERELLPYLSDAPVRILKVAHHGSRTSTSQELLDAWRPHYALISAGRGNSFGHPTPEVLRRLEASGAQVLRTDQHGQITLETDGAAVVARSFVGGRNEPRRTRRSRR